MPNTSRVIERLRAKEIALICINDHGRVLEKVYCMAEYSDRKKAGFHAAKLSLAETHFSLMYSPNISVTLRKRLDTL